MEEKKYVTYRHLKIGQEISGTKSGNSCSGFRGYIKSVNAAYVIVEMWNPGGNEERFSSAETLFGIEMTEEEIRQKYNDKAGKIVAAMKNRLEKYEIGPHEMWNSWLSSNPWEMAQACAKEKLTILGCCYDIIPKHAMFSGDLLDVGVCVEDEDGDKFWCHFSRDSVEIMKRRYERYQEYMREGRTSEYNGRTVDFEYLEEKYKTREESAN